MIHYPQTSLFSSPFSCFKLIANAYPHRSDADRSTKAFPDGRTFRAERADPPSNAVRCGTKGVRPEGHVHPVRVFALCISQAPRPAATFGSFWSLQKEPAGGREFGEMWMLNLIFRICFKLTAEPGSSTSIM